MEFCINSNYIEISYEIKNNRRHPLPQPPKKETKKEVVQFLLFSQSKTTENERIQSTYLAPMESIVQMKGLFSSPSPAITGWQK